MNKFNYNINISRVGAISKHLLTSNFKNKQSILSFFISDRNYFPMLRKFIKKWSSETSSICTSVKTKVNNTFPWDTPRQAWSFNIEFP